MPPFLQFRMWMREAPAGERTLAGIAAAIVVVLIGVALVPVAEDDGGGDETVAAGTAGVESGDDADASAAPEAGATPEGGTGGDAGAAGPAGTGGTGGSATSGGGGGSGAAATGGAPAGCQGLTASSRGVTANEVRVALSVISLAGPIGNATFDIRPDIHEIGEAIAEEFNKNGGVACGRRLVLKHYDVNPLSADDSRTKCLQMVEDNPFLVIDVGGYLRAANRRCFVDAKLPLIGSLAIPESEAKETFPYILSPRNYAEQQARDGILGLRATAGSSTPRSSPSWASSVTHASRR